MVKDERLSVMRAFFLGMLKAASVLGRITFQVIRAATVWHTRRLTLGTTPLSPEGSLPRAKQH